MSIDPATLPRLYHGGAPGLEVGDLIEPGHNRTVDGCLTCAARDQGKHHIVPGQGSIDPPTGRPDRVYVTSDRAYGRYYASLAGPGGAGGGDLYVVDLVGEVEESTEDRFRTWCAPAARVTTVFTRNVRRFEDERARLDARWLALDNAAFRARQAAAYAEWAALTEDGTR